VIHGLITSIFLFYFEDPSGDGVGWNGTSTFLTPSLGDAVQFIGMLLWSMAVFTFVLSGIAVLLRKKEWRVIDILASIISLIAYLLFWDGLKPEPFYWILGPVISIVTLAALIVFRWPTDEYIFGAD
jgi:hypothetical protein